MPFSDFSQESSVLTIMQPMPIQDMDTGAGLNAGVDLTQVEIYPIQQFTNPTKVLAQPLNHEVASIPNFDFLNLPQLGGHHHVFGVKVLSGSGSGSYSDVMGGIDLVSENVLRGHTVLQM